MLVWLKFIAAFLQPPGLNFLLLLVGVFYWVKSNKFMSVFFIFGGTVFLYLISTPIVSNQLVGYLERKYSSYKFYDLANNKDPKAVVALAATDPIDIWDISKNTAWLAKSVRLPVLVSGNNYIAEASGQNNIVEKMAKSLANDFGVTGAVWVESKGYHIKQNAKLVKKILEQNGIKKIFLVANAWRMERAEKEFKSVGLDVIPAPILNKMVPTGSQIKNFTPRIESLANSSDFFYWLFEGALSQMFEMVDG